MEKTRSTSVPDALKRALAANKSLLRSKNNWSVLAELPQSTVLDAFRPNKNPTIDTLSKMAAAAKMTVSELLEYGDPEWEAKVAARQLLKGMEAGEIKALTVILRGRSQNGGSSSS